MSFQKRIKKYKRNWSDSKQYDSAWTKSQQGHFKDIPVVLWCNFVKKITYDH